MADLRVFAFAGSRRQGSYNQSLLKLAVSKLREAGVAVDEFDTRVSIVPMYEQEFEATQGFPDVVRDMRQRILASDAVLIVSPEYNAGYTALTKSVLDWGSRKDQSTGTSNVWDGKTCATLAASPGAFGGTRGLIALRPVLAHVRMHVIPDSFVLPFASDAWTPEGGLSSERNERELDAALTTFRATGLKLKG